jgi:uncharacterized protein (DUF1800 family)
MNRREFFASAFSAESVALESAGDEKNGARADDLKRAGLDGAMMRVQSTRPRPTSGIAQFTGRWNAQTARHLARRAMFGATEAQIAQLAGMTITQAVDLILQDVPLPEPPLDITTGQTWHNKPFVDGATDARYYNYLRAWWIGLMVNQPPSVWEKMTLFWHNHFVSDRATVGDSRYLYQQNALFRRSALGNFRTLCRDITIDPTMLRYLNGNTNIAARPNQNYARELLELFTIGKGAERAQGDYTNYTEQDVQQAARVLTGWSVRANQTTAYSNGYHFESFFNANNHDTGNKTFSAAFQNTVITGRTGASAGMDELNDLLNMIFRQAETARFIVRKLYRWFVYYVIDQTVERNVIEPLAEIFRRNDYNIKPVLRALFLSQHFYDAENRGAMIKSPADFIVALHKQFFPNNPTDQTQLIPAMNRYIGWFAALQMSLFQHPTVAGWEAYYQEPSYYQLWLSTATLPVRNSYSDQIINTTTLDRIAIIRSLTTPSDPYAMVDQLAERYFSMSLTTAQREDLVTTVLMGGSPYYEWTEQWNDFTRNQNDMTKRRAVDTRISNLLRFMLRMGEYQLT